MTRLRIAPDRWVTTWTGDAARVDLAPASNLIEIALEGKAAGASKGSIIAASTEDWQIAPDSLVVVRAEALDQPVTLALALRTDEYYESPTHTIEPGAVRELVFAAGTNTFKSASSKWSHTARVNGTSPLRTVELVIYPAAGEARRLRLHSVVLDPALGPAPEPVRRWQDLALGAIRAPAGDVPRYGRFEVSFDLATAYTNPFDPDEIAVDALFTSPAGETMACPAFLYEQGLRPEDPDEWRVRFSPGTAGGWTWKIRGVTPLASVETESREMTCAPSTNAGPIRISARDPLYFERADGTFYYPIGHNVCWNGLNQYEEQFARMAGHGENWSRIWVAPWNVEIEWSARAGRYKGLGWYNVDHAKTMDRIIELAERNGLHLQIVLHEHCRVSARTNPEWQNNPHNAANGGPCAAPEDFFTNEVSRRHTRNRLRYIVARWGCSDAVMAWELFNEVDLSDNFRFDRDAAWHKEMAAFLKAVDPHRRMVTTSYISNPNPGVCGSPLIDYTQSHVYTPELVQHFVRLFRAYRGFNKPHFVGEFGRDARDGVDAEDTEGRVLHSGLWAQFLLPEAGNAMSWWWYDLIDPRGLYHAFAALSRFAQGLDRRGTDWSHQVGSLVLADGRTAKALAMAATDKVLLWIYDPAVIPWSDKGAARSAGLSGRIELTGLPDGPWTVEQWDTYEGTIASSREQAPVEGRLLFEFQTGRPDMAFKLTRAGGAPGDKAPEVALEPWDPVGERAGTRFEFGIPAPAQPITLDGALDEWTPFPMQTFGPRDGRAPEDHGVEFSVLHQDGDLLVGVRVTDDHVVRQQTEPNTLWKDDCVELWIDSRNDAAGDFNNMPHNPGCYQVNLAPPAEPGGPVDHVVYRHPFLDNRKLDAVQAASARTANGYTMEVRIPLATLRGNTPVTDPAVIGFSLSACDNDPNEEWKHLLWQGSQEWDARQWARGRME